MNAEEYLSIVSGIVIFQIPLLLIAVIGLQRSSSRKLQMPLAAKWASRGFVLLIIYSLISVAQQFFSISLRAATADLDASMVALSRLTTLRFLAYPIFIAAVSMLARAVFLDRDTAGTADDRRAEAVIGKVR